MQLEHSFTVPVGIDQAWQILLDVERVGPCMPGAAIETVEGDDFTGSVKVKLGPINLTYKGKASFVEKDEAAHRVVIDARARDSRGNGTASAKVTAQLAESGGSTTVVVGTDLDITGKPAQFGRGVMIDVGNKLIGQFADCLAATITRGDGDDGAATDTSVADADEPAATSAADPAAEADADAAGRHAADVSPAHDAPGGIPDAQPTSPPKAQGAPSSRPAAPGPAPEVEPINLLESAGLAVAKRVAPIAVATAAVLVLAVARRRRRRR